MKKISFSVKKQLFDYLDGKDDHGLIMEFEDEDDRITNVMLGLHLNKRDFSNKDKVLFVLSWAKNKRLKKEIANQLLDYVIMYLTPRGFY